MTDIYSEPRTSPARPAAPDERSPAEIELEIQRTRARMTESVDALTWKLSPERLKAEARHKLHETQEAVVEKVRHTAHEIGDQAKQAGSGLFGTMKDNPIPSAMIGAGIAWLIMGRRRGAREFDDSSESYGRYYSPQSYTAPDTAMYGPPAGTVGATTGGDIHSSPAGASYGAAGTSGMESESRHGVGERASELRDSVAEKTSHARERVAETAANARELVSETTADARDKIRDTAHSARERASDLGHGAADRARRTRGWAEQQMEENPLVMGAAVLALGAVVGSLVPTTRKEDELLGPRRDQLVDRARSTMHDAREVIGTTARETMDSVKEEVGLQKDAVRDAAADLSSELQTSARKVAHDAKETARSEAEQRNLM